MASINHAVLGGNLSPALQEAQGGRREITMHLRLEAVGEEPGKKPARQMTRRRAAEMVAPVQDQRLRREILELPDGVVEPSPTLLAPEMRRSGRAREGSGLRGRRAEGRLAPALPLPQMRAGDQVRHDQTSAGSGAACVLVGSAAARR